MSTFQVVQKPEGKFKIKFLPNNVEIDVFKDGENLLKIAMAAGVHINASCGGIGSCGKCKVKIKGDNYIGGKSPKLEKEEIEEGFRLACLTKVKGPIEVDIPKESQIDSSVFQLDKDFLLSSSKIKHLLPSFSLNPTVFKIYLELDKPNKDDNINDLDRLIRAIKKKHKFEKITATFDVVLKLPYIIRESDWKVNVTLVALEENYKIIDVDPGTINIRNYALAVDIGTTSVSAQLIDLNKCFLNYTGIDEVDISGHESVVGEHSLYNAQVSYGEDVITRIVFSLKGDGLKTLQQAIVKTLNEIIENIINKSNISKDEISFMVVAANTTMTQLFLGVSPKYIREAPYVPTAKTFPLVHAHLLGLNLPNHIYTYTFPTVSSYVGGDIVSGVLATGIYQQREITLFMDIGTNGEIVLGNQDWLVCTSCSAGPAFEGGGIKNGMRASLGAIDHVKINPTNFEPMIMAIGDDSKPIGICGSGLIEIISEMLITGIINQNGKFNRDLNTPRVREGDEGGYEYVLVWAKDSGIGTDIVINEADIDNLMRAKGAIFAGCKTLLDSVGMTFKDLQRVIIAGGFGKFINLERAVEIGLFPEIDFNKFIYVGNSSLLGSRLVSFSKDLMRTAENISNMMTNIELADNVNFMSEFIAATFLPHTDINLFPNTIKKISSIKK